MVPRIVQIGARSEPHRDPSPIGRLCAAALCLCLALAPALAGCHGGAGRGAASGPGGPFLLVNQDGRAADQSVLRGKWSVVFFGYTFCPDVCPTTLAMLNQTMKALGPRADRVQVVFITVDPARDTPAKLKTYLSSPAFPRNAIGLTGSDAQVARAAKAYYVYYRKDGAGADYTVDHTAALYLMGPDGQFVKPIADGTPPADAARQIAEAMDGAKTAS